MISDGEGIFSMTETKGSSMRCHPAPRQGIPEYAVYWNKIADDVGLEAKVLERTEFKKLMAHLLSKTSGCNKLKKVDCFRGPHA